MFKQKHIVIIGAGFAGLKLARILNNYPTYQVTLIDRNNYHQFQPLLYQVATANLDASNVSFPLRTIFQKSKNVKIRVAEVDRIKSGENKIETSTGTIFYDFLVVATGANTNYFGNKSIENNTFPMKSTIEALELRNQLIQNLEDASVAKDAETVQRLLTIVIVGGGPTGIELGGALTELKRDTLPKEYPELNFNNMKIYLLEGSNMVLGSMSSSASFHSKRYLEEMGVIVKVNAIVKDYDANQVLLKDGSTISSALVIWTAGVIGNVPEGIDKGVITKDFRIQVDKFNKIIGSKNMYALGDIAFVKSSSKPNGLPQLGNVAIDQAKRLGRNFKNVAKGKVMKEYGYRNKGTMATIGKNKAVVDLARPHISFRGFAAWFVWMAVHLFLLIGFKNRILVFINWIYKYFTSNESLSLLFTPLLRKKNRSEEKEEVPELFI